MIEAHEFDRVLKFWKPLEGKEYACVVFSDWRIAQGTFGDELKMKVMSTDDEHFVTPKDFNTKSSSFITQVRPMILSAQEAGSDIIALSLRYSNKKYQLFDRTAEIMQPVRKAYPGVKLGPAT
jgi:hypothetical protein